MELVYLWVEEYKNIKEQGFNFSPRFECKYDKDSNELTIDENEDYISIFPDNINVTAIVGENGSGKTTILSLINIITSKINVELNTKYILIVDINKKIHYRTNIKNFSYSNYINEIHNISVLTHLHNINISSEEESKKLTYSVPIDRLKLSAYEITQLITMHLQENQTIKITPFLYLPTKIHIKPKDYSDIFDMLIYDNDNIPNESIELAEAFEDIDNKFHKFLFLFFIEQEVYNIKELSNFKLLRNKISEYPHVPQNKEEFKKVFSEKTLTISHLTKKEKEIFIYNYHNYFNFDYIDEQNRNYNSLSTGEQTLFSLLLNIFYFIQVSIKHNSRLLITLDEFDLSLHPNWQKKYLTELFVLLTNLKEKCHLIIASHSPFILSDVPKENVIFLKNGKQEFPFIEKEQTFGANIHTLLSHGFFMKDGLMGEFAKGKIEEIKKFYELVKRFEEEDFSSPNSKSNLKHIFLEQKVKFRHIQSIIGEPFLQTVIKNYLDELDIIFNGKKQFLQNEIKRLQELESSL